MSEHDGEEGVVFEIAVAVPKSGENKEDESDGDCIEVLVDELRKKGLIVERVVGLQNEIIKLAATMEILGKAAAELRFQNGLIYRWFFVQLVNTEKSAVVLKSDDEKKRKQLLRSWAMNWLDFTSQPIDDICSYYGIKIIAVAGSSFFFICLISWAAMFFQFWKRKNSALSARLQIYHSVGAESEYKSLQTEQSSCQSPTELMKKLSTDRMKEKAAFQREEWFRWLMRLRNDALIIMSIICLQLPFELAYAHLYESIGSDLLKFCLTAIYLLAIQYFTRMGGKISVKLIKYENSENVEYRANSLVYKVIENILENSIPYLSYSFKKFRTVRNKLKREQGSSTAKHRPIPRVEKEYLKPAYAANFLELVLQFGMIMMFACAFPLAFAAVCVLLVCLYDREGKWNLSPGLAAILIMEHVLLFIKFGFSRLVPEEPAWVKAARRKNATHAEQMCSKQLLRSISGLTKKLVQEMKRMSREKTSLTRMNPNLKE
ncbi:hypothetical protein DH2020_041147 [Rehmannia glutinosa]|uniref:Anoctamin transmembrane domain-containing protein n=1 Tax=Rehmannia glutinosa TaxID=99300 RepID=A0ABR0UR41_REHGL